MGAGDAGPVALTKPEPLDAHVAEELRRGCRFHASLLGHLRGIDDHLRPTPVSRDHDRDAIPATDVLQDTARATDRFVVGVGGEHDDTAGPG